MRLRALTSDAYVNSDSYFQGPIKETTPACARVFEIVVGFLGRRIKPIASKRLNGYHQTASMGATFYASPHAVATPGISTLHNFMFDVSLCW